MPSEETLRALEHEMGVLARRMRRVLAERARMVAPDLSALSYSMLRLLDAEGPHRAREMVEVFAIDKGAVSRHVQALLELDLVSRRPDPQDGRAAIITITEEGRRRLADVDAQRRQALVRRLDGWSGDDLGAFVESLSRYNAALERPVDG